MYIGLIYFQAQNDRPVETPAPWLIGLGLQSIKQKNGGGSSKREAVVGDLVRGRQYSTALLAGDIVIAPAQHHSSLSAQRPVPAREMNEQTNNPGQASSQNPFACISAPSVPEAYWSWTHC